ncbi:MAG: AAA family ATPase [Candidatus Hydrothermae bacterium]|nr:AAA family ATPase [Candidatus Hydrothermae bacterium]
MNHEALAKSLADPQLEILTLISMLTDEDALYKGLEVLSKDDFSESMNQVLFNEIVKTYSRLQKSFGTGELIAEIKSPELKEYLVQVMAEEIPMADFDFYIEKLKDYTRRRKIFNLMIELQAKIINQVPADDIIGYIETKLLEITQDENHNGAVSIKELLNLDSFKLNEEDYTVKTGIAKLDEELKGLKPGQVMVIGARPGVGKTTLTLNILYNAAKRYNIPALLFSLEMRGHEIRNKLLSLYSKIDAYKLIYNPDDRILHKVEKTRKELEKVPLYIDDSSSLTIEELGLRAKRYKLQYGIKLLAIDYLQLLRTRVKTHTAYERVSLISQTVKSLAKDLNLPVILISQLNREPERIQINREPRLADLRDSGAIEQDADIVLLMWRDNNSHEGDGEYDMNIKIAKHRYYKTSSKPFKLKFKPEYSYFYSEEDEAYENLPF